ncbi:hypothetical protein TESG_07312 [Trichophyton tonsurans CBS 112818]|uniref:Uncharacterized protein n=1 Tax=Trichophyton tonsurans (strain CBS 112818) TaxID=647933 RepID=F2S8T5_TRIT1|nr:hypothetical protein TESG_07312 [Trichophyton tonsurans CBS 112818]
MASVKHQWHLALPGICTTLNMMGILFILWAEPAWPLRDKCLTVNAESSAEMVCVSECQRINGDSRTLLAPFRQMQCYSDLGSYTHSYTPPPGSPPPASSDAAAFSKPSRPCGLVRQLGCCCTPKALAEHPRHSWGFLGHARTIPGTLTLTLTLPTKAARSEVRGPNRERCAMFNLGILATDNIIPDQCWKLFGCHQLTPRPIM